MSFARFLTLAIGSIVLALSILFTSIGVLREYRESLVSRSQYQNSAAELLSQSVREPLMQGAFVETRARIESAIEAKLILCARVTYGTEIVLNCDSKIADEKSAGHALTVVDKRIFTDSAGTVPLARIEIYFDNSDLIISALEKAGFWLASSLIIGLAVGAVVFYVFRLIRRDLQASISQLSSHNRDLLTPSRIQEFAFVSSEIERLLLEAKASAEQKASFEVAKQVSHDIRSPLSALNMVMKNSDAIPEEQRLMIRSVTQRINDIANGLLKSAKAKESSTTNIATSNERTSAPVMLVSLVDTIVSEKRIQFADQSNTEIRAELSNGYGLFSEISAVELARVISNLVNNSVESFSSGGVVTVGIREEKGNSVLTITDNGRGIPSHLLATLGQSGVTEGKAGTSSGSGMGLYHARTTIEKVGGEFSIESSVGVGTKISITLTNAAPPKWFVKELSFRKKSLIVSADDDQTIHQIWAGRLISAGSEKAGVQHVRFTSFELFKSWAMENKKKASWFFVDYEFVGQHGNGLDAIQDAGIADKSILVTSRYEELHVRSRAESMNVPMIPKGLVSYVPMEIL